MGTLSLITAAEYLHTHYASPEPDFVDGEVRQRAMPNSFHSESVDALIAAFIRRAPDLFRRPELRLRTGEHYRVADLAVFDRKPSKAVPSEIPLVVIEVLSPDESLSELMGKFADYAAAGVPHIWLVDPMLRRFWIYRAESLLATARFELTKRLLVIEPSDIFED